MKDEDVLLELIFNCRKAQILFIAAKLKISDILDNCAKTIDEIARQTNTHTDSLYRIMRAMSGIGLYKEKKTKCFELAPMGEFLKENDTSGVRINALMHLDDWGWKPWGELLYSVQTGKSAFEKVFGENLFDYLSGHPDKLRIFNKAFEVYTTYCAQSLLEEYDFSPCKVIADIGGSQGILIKKILEKYPGKKGILFDLPNVINEIRGEFMTYDISHRCGLVGGNFFNSTPEGCDLYLLKNIIHDWDDEHSLKILKNCHRALNSNGKIVLIENVIMNDGNNSPDVFMIDVGMLVGTGGRERTGEEYRTLLVKAGFTPAVITKDYVEGIKWEK